MSDVVYVGKDLEAMSFAENYHRWILDEFRPFIGQNVVEVGAGTGDFSRLLLDEAPKTLTLVEPSDMFEQLSRNLDSKTIKINFYKDIFAEIADKISHDHPPDTILYVNVLEHIEDDANELRLIHRSLSSHGKALVFVPALQQLYGEFDRHIGHFRRYTKRELVQKAEDAGFKILVAKYFDFAGIVPWFVKYKVFRSSTLSGDSVKLYDKFAVPVNRILESIIQPPLGKNLLLVCEKT